MPEELRRREVLGLGVGGGAALLGLRISPARADTALDVQIVQTAASLETLAIAVYERVLASDMPPPMRTFATETLRRHGAHRKAFQDRTTALDGAARVQDAPNGKFLPTLAAADLGTPAKLVDFLATIEKVVTDTYLTNLAVVQDSNTRALVASVMAVEAQHLAHLRLVAVLMETGGSQLLADPFPPARMKDLPHTAGRRPFPDARHSVGGPEVVAEPSSGAVR